jgi:hypothetical protein
MMLEALKCIEGSVLPKVEGYWSDGNRDEEVSLRGENDKRKLGRKTRLEATVKFMG